VICRTRPRLTGWLLDELLALRTERSRDGSHLWPSTTQARGGTVTLNLYDPLRSDTSALKELLDASIIRKCPLRRIVEVEPLRSPARLCRRRAIDANHRATVAVPKSNNSSSSHPVRQRTRSAITSMPIACRWRRPISTAGIGEVIQGAVFKGGFIRGQHVCLALDRRKIYGAAGKPWTLQLREGCFVNEDAPTPVGSRTSV